MPDWKGWYILFGQDFLVLNPLWKYFIVDFPFFRLDKTIPFDLPPEDAQWADHIFQKMFVEYHSENKDKFNFIQSYVSLLLFLTKRYYDILIISDKLTFLNRTADIFLLSRFQAMVETSIASEEAESETRQPSFYADKLHVHPNHLNAVTKRITGKTAGSLIQIAIIANAKSLLIQTHLSVKEVAFQLHFFESTQFIAFFKKVTGFTPQQYRANQLL